MMLTKLGPNHSPRNSTKALFCRYCNGLLNRIQFEFMPAHKSLITRQDKVAAKVSKRAGIRPLDSGLPAGTEALKSKVALKTVRAYLISPKIVTAFSHWATVSMIVRLHNITRDWVNFVRLLCWLLLQVI